ncbi:MAG: CvpA family protein [Pseudoxanthomonas sp.]
MPLLDLVLLALIGVSALFGLLRGFVGAIASILAWVLAGWVAFRHGGQVAVWLSDDGQPMITELFGGYALGFVAVMVFVGLVGWFVGKLVKGVGLSGLDRLLGLVLGAARGGVIACALVLLLGFTDLPREPEWQQSRVVPALQPGVDWMRGWLPEWVAERLVFGNNAPSGDNGVHSEPLPLPLDEGVRQPATPEPSVQEPSVREPPVPEPPAAR